MMSPEEYDAWYATSRGKWIGDEEYQLIASMLAPLRDETLLDAGCGTGYFTRRFARNVGSVIGTDSDSKMLRFAAKCPSENIRYVAADARKLPFRDKSFDLVVSIAALCFIREEKEALREMLRVARRGLALGLLNRHSLLYFRKGTGGGKGGYRGAHWHTPGEAVRLLEGLSDGRIDWRTIIMLPEGEKRWGRALEARLRDWFPGCGAFIAISLKE